MNLQRFRNLRRPVIPGLLPLLAAVWIASAATPCAAMATEGRLAGGAHAHDTIPAENADGAPGHHQPGCPHCPPHGGDQAPDDPSAHALCAADDALVKDFSAKLAKRELVVAWLGSRFDTLSPSFARANPRRAPCPDRPQSPTPAYLRFCVFLN